jgi:hypothetical protein
MLNRQTGTYLAMAAGENVLVSCRLRRSAVRERS